MLLLMACLVGFVLGVVVRRWWVVAAAVPVGIVTYWATPSRHWKEDNLAGFVGFMAFALVAASIGLGLLVGVLLRRASTPS